MNKNEKYNKILKLHEQGLTNRAIAKELNVSKSGVGYVVKKFGLISHGHCRKPHNWIDDEHKQCSKCQKCKHIDEYPKARVGREYEYTRTSCQQCVKEYQIVNLQNNIDRYFNDRQRRLKTKCLNGTITYNLSPGYLYELYKIQDGKCFYTGLEMNNNIGKGLQPDSISTDRIDPNKGYTTGNVVLCQNRINTVKSNLTLDEIKEYMPAWYEKIIKGVNEIQIPRDNEHQ